MVLTLPGRLASTSADDDANSIKQHLKDWAFPGFVANFLLRKSGHFRLMALRLAARRRFYLCS